MLHVLFTIILLQAATILSMVFKTPARKLVVLGLDRTKRGRGPIIAKSVAGTVLAVLLSSLNGAFKTWRRMASDAEANPTDQVLMAKQLLEASLMGFFLFLALIADRLHYYIRELHMKRSSEASRKSDKFGGFEEIEAREVQVGTFKDIVRQLGSDLDTKTEELAAADAEINALRKQSEELLLEYDCILSENQEFRGRLLSLGQQLSSKT